MCFCAFARVRVVRTSARAILAGVPSPNSLLLLLQAHRQLATIYFEAVCGFLTFSDGHVYRRRCADLALAPHPETKYPQGNPMCPGVTLYMQAAKTIYPQVA